MDWVGEIASRIFWFMKESAFYMVVGIVIAGFLRYVISEKRFSRAFGKNDLKSSATATLLGIPLPLCSCSVLPMMISLRERGASKGATTSFLISTPETGVDSISITYALLDPIFTVARPIAALITALTTGSVVNLFVRKGWDDKKNGEKIGSQEPDASADQPHSSPGSPDTTGEGGKSCCSSNNNNDESGKPLVARAFRYGFITLMNDLTPLLILAFTCSGIIAAMIPDTFFQNPVTQGWPGMFLMLIVGIPLYVCATSSTPLVAALLLKGLSPGAAFVFLLSGPVTNLGTIYAVSRYLGVRVMWIYIACTAGLTLFMGGIIDTLYRDLGRPVEAIVGQATDFLPEPVKVLAFLFLVGLMAASAWRTRMLTRWGEKLRTWCKPLHFDPLGKSACLAYLVILIFLYVCTGLSVLQVGEVGWISTFGQVERDAQGRVVTKTAPGLYYHYPYPFQTLIRAYPDQVRKVNLGFRENPSSTAQGQYLAAGEGSKEMQGLDLEAQVMDGEESLVSLRFSVQFRLEDPFVSHFGFDDPEELVRGYAGSSVRTVCARRATQDILVGHRRPLEEACKEKIQSDLDQIGAGVEILHVSFCDVHAPTDVHYYFRDVASASEEKHMMVLNGESAFHEILAAARGEAFRIEKEAEGEGDATLNQAKGRAFAFKERSDAFNASPELTRLRMLLDTLQEVLRPARTVWPLAEGVDLELWLRSAQKADPPFLEETGAEQNSTPIPNRPPGEPEGADENTKEAKPKKPEWLDAFNRR